MEDNRPIDLGSEELSDQSIIRLEKYEEKGNDIDLGNDVERNEVYKLQTLPPAVRLRVAIFILICLFTLYVLSAIAYIYIGSEASKVVYNFVSNLTLSLATMVVTFYFSKRIME